MEVIDLTLDDTLPNIKPEPNQSSYTNNDELPWKSRKKTIFKPPREAPVFHPTIHEFQDCLNYVKKIKPIAEKYGICKIIPPKGWQPPFALDINQLKVQPRLQKINELDAHTRIKLNFIYLVLKFWQLQGRHVRRPILERDRTLDLYTLRKLVHKEGGFDEVNKLNLWESIAKQMECTQKNAPNVLRLHYEDLLHPYDIYVSENPDLDFSIEKLNSQRNYRNKHQVNRTVIDELDGNDEPNVKNEVKAEQVADVDQTDEGDCIIKNVDVKKDEAGISEFKLEVKEETSDSKKDIKENKELKKLQFFGAGPKMAGLPTVDSSITKRESKSPKQNNSASIYNCLICDKDDKEKVLMICAKCSATYHTYCLKPALKEVPKGEWHCPSCLAGKIRKCIPAYGFETSPREYSLRQFGEMADLFKCQYFQMPVHEVSNSAVEQEFWRITRDLDETVTVEYGADLHSMDHGSGFPTTCTDQADDVYVKSQWNLNNLPVADGSVLGHIGGDISGMKIPWMYVGMCFSAFCWHNEDHWSYSINYLHWGEAKTWYGLPGDCADRFEEVMKEEAPELFESQPDLLHQLVTIMNPNVFVDRGLPVSRLDQQAGEFVITFPRAYHSGFNQGYNFAEAVNFSPYDWLPIGRQCISHYAQLQRFCVFAHDELVCKMASLTPNDLGYDISEALLQDVVVMTENERNYRKLLLDNGIQSAKKVNFELIPDNERMCRECKTTCFLSAIQCSRCNNGKYVCIKHWDKVCKCPFTNYVLCYRYTIDDISRMAIALKVHVSKQRRWIKSVEQALNPKSGAKVNLNYFKKLVDDAKWWKNPKSEYLYALNKVIDVAECCIDIINQLKSAADSDSANDKNDDVIIIEDKLTYHELMKFVEELDALPCEIDEVAELDKLLAKIEMFQSDEKKLYTKDWNDIEVGHVKMLFLQSQQLCIKCPEIEAFYDKFQQFTKSKRKS